MPDVPLEYGSTHTSVAGLIATSGGVSPCANNSAYGTAGACSPNTTISRTVPARRAAAAHLSYRSGTVNSITAPESANCTPISSAVAAGLTVEQMAPMETMA